MAAAQAWQEGESRNALFTMGSDPEEPSAVPRCHPDELLATGLRSLRVTASLPQIGMGPIDAPAVEWACTYSRGNACAKLRRQSRGSEVMDVD